MVSARSYGILENTLLIERSAGYFYAVIGPARPSESPCLFDAKLVKGVWGYTFLF